MLHPKYYRRLVTWAANKRAKMSNGTFVEFLHDVNERCVALDDDLQEGAKAASRRLSDFVGDDGSNFAGTEESGFKEKNSRLIGTDGKRVVGW